MTVNLGELRILLVDDQPASRVTLRTMLRNIGVTQTYEAGNGREAIEFLSDARDFVDVVLTDLVMPEVDGVELFGHCRSSFGDLPVLLASGHCDRSALMRAKSAGVWAFLAKPFSLDQLKRKLTAVLDASRQPRPEERSQLLVPDHAQAE